ncbi:hypothetical protein J3R30DRAFT_3698981 [Lentinula aciculospora]|uniref:C2H2-type domain-containing protein n=1 Tax=Lentinula aciculospora TaxID=153920 RepID=A0A9W9AKN1_9AGAR|nr:hypothetical protein J3R30DRAFT_3698981 [Lentinula aciculospora]
MHGNSRTYSYDDQGIGYSQNNAGHGGGHTSSYSYTQQIYPEQNSDQFYPSASQFTGITAHGHPDPRYGRSTTPAPGIGHRYGRHPTDPRYYHSSGTISSSSSHSGNGPPSAHLYSTNQYPPSQNPPSHRDRFIPTPSEIALYGNYPGSVSDQHASQSPATYSTPGHYSRHHRQTSMSPILSTSRATSARSPHASTTSPSNERYPCEICGKTFSRSHDRKRHHETQHIASPVLHRCRYCRKEFSRADSLKRHLDNGCDEMPANSNK